MAHLLPYPAPINYWVPSLTEFSITSANGEGELLGWGVSTPDSQHFTVGLESGLNGRNARMVCTPYSGPRPDLVFFRLRGVWTGDVLVLYRNINFGVVGKDAQWEKYSGSVRVKVVTAALATESLAKGDATGDKLPRYAAVPKIRFYPFGSQQRDPPISDDDWMKSLVPVLDKIGSVGIGAKVMALLPDPTIIYPYIPENFFANSLVLFTPANFNVSTKPGSTADEVLFHEFIHRCEGGGKQYENVPGWEFSGTDFLSVNAANVYSCLLGRALRKDHAGMELLPREYFNDPEGHFKLFRRNYAIAWQRAPTLCQSLRNASELWNPFKFTP